jgi:hypothetical protein
MAGLSQMLLKSLSKIKYKNKKKQICKKVTEGVL